MNLIHYLRNRLKLEWSKSIRRQLAWSFSLMSLSVIIGSGCLLYSFQRNFLYAQGTKNAFALARTLSFSSVSWVLANDVVGLQEVMKGAAESVDIKFAVVLTPQGEVLASTNPEYIGQFFSDTISQRLLALQPGPQKLAEESNLVDVAVPIQAGNSLIGWVRVELTRDTANTGLRRIAVAGLGLAIFLVLTITLISTWLARRLSRGLNRLAGVANDAEHGRPFQRQDIQRTDEIGVLARHLYRMLDTVSEEKKARLESEERWKFALEGAGDGVWDWDVQNEQVVFTERWKKMLGYAEHEFENSVEAWKQQLHPDDAKISLAALQDCFEGRAESYEREYRMHCKDGSWKWILARGKVVARDANGRVLRIIGTHTDISERKRGEEELRKFYNEMEQRIAERTAALTEKADDLSRSQQALQYLLEDVNEAKKELETKIAEIERMNKIFVHRELRMVELKEKIRTLEQNRHGSADIDPGQLS